MHLSDEEIAELYDILNEHCLYGDDEIVYTSKGDTARAVWEKVTHEAKRRKLW